MPLLKIVKLYSEGQFNLDWKPESPRKIRHLP